MMHDLLEMMRSRLFSVCERITDLPLCSNFYNATHFPNTFGQTSQTQVINEGQTYLTLLSALGAVNCHSNDMEFICAVLAPKCDASGTFP